VAPVANAPHAVADVASLQRAVVTTLLVARTTAVTAITIAVIVTAAAPQSANAMSRKNVTATKIVKLARTARNEAARVRLQSRPNPRN
jgi:hypothetical protein